LLSLILDNAIRYNQGARSAFGQRHDATYSRVPKLCTPTGGIVGCCARAASGHADCAAEQHDEFAASFDHLVGDGEQARRYVEAEGPCSPEVDGELKPSRLLYWQLGRPCTSEHPVYVHGDLSVKISRL
jgi:hypothetical protein